MIQLYNLTKEFNSGKEKITAVDSLDFKIKRGEIFGLLGPNGAGKTTTVKLLSTLVIPTSGTAVVNGYDIVNDERAVRGSIDISVGNERSFYFRLSGYQNLEFFAAMQGLSGRYLKFRIREIMRRMNLDGSMNMKFMKYSSGMKKKLNIARAILNDSPIYFFDEPTAAIDPQAAVEIRDSIKDLSRRGKTVLLTTHNMVEAEELCDRIAILNKGRVAVIAAPETLKKEILKTIVKVRLDLDESQILSNLISSETIVKNIEINNDGWLMAETDDRCALIALIHKMSSERKFQLIDLKIEEPTLEDVFISVTGEKEC